MTPGKKGGGEEGSSNQSGFWGSSHYTCQKQKILWALTLLGSKSPS